MIVRWHSFRNQIEPDGQKLYVDRATAQALNGSYHAARVDLEKAIALDKNNILAHNNYAWLLATCPDDSVRDGHRAVQHARGASETLKHGSQSFSILSPRPRRKSGIFARR